MPHLAETAPANYQLALGTYGVSRMIEFSMMNIEHIEKSETVGWMEGEATITPQFGLTTATPQYWGLTRMSSDTIYHFIGNQQLRPALVRTPSIHSMDKKRFLSLVVENDRYCFLHVLDKDFDLNTMKGFGTKNLMYDKQGQVTFIPVLLDNDFFRRKGNKHWSAQRAGRP